MKNLIKRSELFEWLDTCPSDKWKITRDDYGYVVIGFPNDEDDIDDLFIDQEEVSA